MSGINSPVPNSGPPLPVQDLWKWANGAKSWRIPNVYIPLVGSRACDTLECGELLTLRLRSVHRKVRADTQGNDLGRNNVEDGDNPLRSSYGRHGNVYGGSFREQQSVGPRKLATSGDGLRCAPTLLEKARTRPGAVSPIPTDVSSSCISFILCHPWSCTVYMHTILKRLASPPQHVMHQLHRANVAMTSS